LYGKFGYKKSGHHATEHLKWIFSKKKLHTNAARISRHLRPSSLRRRHRKNRGYDGVGGFAVTFCILGNIWKKQVAKMDFLDFLFAISCRFGVRGPLLERVPVHAPQYRGHTLVLKNDYTSFQKNRKSVTKARPKNEEMLCY
jgi:hypothetical protein